MPRRPDVLVAEAACLDTVLGRKLAALLPLAETRESIAPADYPRFGPEVLILARHRGRFVKTCPGTPEYNCCGLKIIHLGLGCGLNCSYCILQGYLDTSAFVVFGNWDEAEKEIRASVESPGADGFRFCTGEFTDSLLLEDWTGLGAGLVRLFAETTGAILELKTKTVNVRGLLDLEHRGRTVISFSMNAPEVARAEEPGAASLAARLAAAREVARVGYGLGFHFDPLVLHPGWPDGYARTVADIFSAVPADQVAWISLGAFRYLPLMKPIIRRRHPTSRVTDAEFILAPDGKQRYPRPIRVEMYRHMLTTIRKWAPQVLVYLCMESPRVWREVFGVDPGSTGLTAMLDARVI